MRRVIAIIVIALTTIIGGAGIAAAHEPDYTVRTGDTLSELRPTTWREVCAVNVAEGRIPHCDLIITGQLLWLGGLEPAPRVNAAPKPRPVVPKSSGWAIPESIVMCESGGDYGAENPTSTASGAYQIIDSTWDGYGGYNHASDAPPAVQDARAAQIWDGGAGRSHWVC